MSSEEDDKVRILIIHHEDLIKPEMLECFDDTNVEAVMVTSLVEAVGQLDEWREEGIYANIVDIEDFPGVYPFEGLMDEDYEIGEALLEHQRNHYSGAVDFIGFLRERSEQESKRLNVGKFFMHSRVPEAVRNSLICSGMGRDVLVHHYSEYEKAHLYKKYGDTGSIPSEGDKVLRQYLRTRYRIDGLMEDDALDYPGPGM